MILLGLILIIIGAALFYFFAEPIVRFIAAVLAILGLVLVILAVADAGDLSLGDNNHAANPPRSSWGAVLQPALRGTHRA